MAGRTSLWKGPQLAAQWLAERGPMPGPVSHAIYRETTRSDGPATTAYTLHDEPGTLTREAFEQWLLRHKLGGPSGLGLSLLVIREVLDVHGAIRECVIERRRGATDGPLCGDPARVEFLGPARSVRLYTVDTHGRLVEAMPPTPPTPPRHDITEGFSAEDQAIRAHFGQAAIVLDRRSPTLFEEMAGLSSIVHVRTRGGDVGCGIGWHGPMVYLLIGDFPRLDHGLALPPDAEEAVADALRAHKLVRYEMRFDSEGLAVMASRRDRQELVIVRPDNDQARVAPYAPGDATVGSPDQRRWIRYAEGHEGRVALDAYQDGASDELVVLTGDANGQVWRHRIDPDGVEVACGPANETAVAMLYRARRTPIPPEDGLEPVPLGLEAEGDWPDLPPEPDSLLAKTQAFAEAVALLRAARDAALSWSDTATSLHALMKPLRVLGARGTATALHGVLRRGDRAAPPEHERLRALDGLAQRLHEELADIRVAAEAADRSHPLADWAIEEAFPEATYHIQEACHCLALRRPSAAVFHGTQVVRVGLRAIADGAGGSAISEWSRLMAAMEARDDLSLAILTALRRLRRAWRAPTLLPADKYTEEEAEGLLDATAAFMRAVVDDLPS